MKIHKKILFIFFFLVILLTVILFPRFILIKNIDCNNQYGSCDENILNDLNKSLNKKLLIAKKEISNLFSNNIMIRDYSIQYKIPNTLSINLILEKTKYCLKSINNDIYSYIDRKGKVLELKNSCNFPVIFVNDRTYNVGEEIGEDYLSALDLLNNIFIFYNVKEGVIIDNYLEVNLTQGYKVILPLNKDNQILLGSLRLIINRLNTDESESRIIEDRINVIDLRYENPVLR